MGLGIVDVMCEVDADHVINKLSIKELVDELGIEVFLDEIGEDAAIEYFEIEVAE